MAVTIDQMDVDVSQPKTQASNPVAPASQKVPDVRDTIELQRERQSRLQAD